MISLDSLTKHYRDVVALQDLTLEIREGEVFGLLGPNGSGKTTTLRIILGMLRPTAGSATVGGFDCWSQSRDVRQMVSFLPGELRLFGPMSGLDTLRFLSDLRGGEALDRAVAIAERVMKLDLSRRVRTFSTGMKQKLALAQAFADPVPILMLDEPTSALDPSARNDVLGLVNEARASGQTVIFSGHVLSEVERVADRVAIMRTGRLMHVEDMHVRRTLRMVLVRFEQDSEVEVPEELGLTVREQGDDAWLFEHRGEVGPLLSWLSTQDVSALAIGTEDLHSLYNRFHGADANGKAVEAVS
jgi:ABC-2 type transport system ATP-binding protein